MYKNARKLKKRKLNIFKYSTEVLSISVLIICISMFLFFRPRCNQVDWDEVYRFKIPINSLFAIEKVSEEYETDFSRMIICYMLENNFFKENDIISINDYIMNYANIKSKYTDDEAEKYYNIVNNIYSEIKKFPVLINENDKSSEYIYGDSFGAERSYGGKRTHQGCDIMDRDNISGRLEIVSMTDGIIEKIGWNEKGGWRVGIRSNSGTYYYYAHLKEYSDGLYEGKEIAAGDKLGLMGDSGYSKIEGATGNFEVHLHIGIAVDDEKWINPYPFLRIVEDNRNIS